MDEEIRVIPLSDRDKWLSLHLDGGRQSQSWHYCWALSSSGVNPMLAVIRSGRAGMRIPFFGARGRKARIARNIIFAPIH